MRGLKGFLAIVLALALLLCATAVSAEEKTTLVIMYENADEPVTLTILDMLRAKFPQYEFVSKQWTTETNAQQAVKTTFATDSEAIDILMYNQSMSSFTESDMALDLTPYLDADPAFRDLFVDGALTGAQNYIDGKVWALPYSSVYPMMEVNTEILAEAGVELNDQWTWAEFVDACQQIADKTDAFPAGCDGNWAFWFGAIAFMQAFETDEEYIDFCNGKVPFTDERIIERMDQVADFYKSGLLYPGDGAISASAEEVNAAFATGKIAIRFDVNSVSKSFLESVGMDPDKIMIATWPCMAAEGLDSAGDRLHGGNNLFFIPSNTKHPDEAVEVLKYIFSEEVQSVYAASGTIVCVKNAGDIDLSEWSKDGSKVAPDAIWSHSAELMTYLTSNWFGDYLFDKDTAIEQFEEYRANFE